MKKNSGQTLIEVLAALTAAVIVTAAIVSASLNALSSSEFTRDQNIASQFTQQGMEIMRNMRDLDIASISATYLPDGTYCLAKMCTSLNKNISSCWQAVPSCPQNADKFVRSVVIAHSATDCNVSPTPVGQTGSLSSNVQVTVTTAWFDPKCTDPTKPFCHSATATSCFSDFTVVPTP